MEVRKLISIFANENQRKYVSLPLFKSVDLSDLIGGYDQKRIIDSVLDIQSQITTFFIQNFATLQENPNLKTSLNTFLMLRKLFENQEESVHKKLDQSLSLIKNLITEKLSENSELQVKHNEVHDFLRNMSLQIKSVICSPIIFKWIDSAVIKALEKGHWLIFENCEQINPALLEKLNGLLEEEETIELSECLSGNSSEGRLIHKHKNFKAFLVFNSHPNKNLQISKPLMNRCVYIHFDKLFTDKAKDCNNRDDSRESENLDELRLQNYNKDLTILKNELKSLFEFNPCFYELVRRIASKKDVLVAANEHDQVNLENNLSSFCFDAKHLLSKMNQFEDCFGEISEQTAEKRGILSILFREDISKLKHFILVLIHHFEAPLINAIQIKDFEMKNLFDHFMNLSYPSFLQQSQSMGNIQNLLNLAQKSLLFSNSHSKQLIEKFTHLVFSSSNENEVAIQVINSLQTLLTRSNDKESFSTYLVKLLLISFACKSNNNVLISSFKTLDKRGTSIENNALIMEEVTPSRNTSNPNQNLLYFVKNIFLMKLSNRESMDNMIQDSENGKAVSLLRDPLLVSKLLFLSENKRRQSSEYILSEISTVISQLFKPNLAIKSEDREPNSGTKTSLWTSLCTLMTKNNFVSIDMILPGDSGANSKSLPTKRFDLESRLEVLSQVLVDVNRKYEAKLKELDSKVYQIKDENNIKCESFLLCNPNLETSFLYLLSNKKLIFERDSMVDRSTHNFKIDNSVLEDYDSVGVIIENIFESLGRLKTQWETVHVLNIKAIQSDGLIDEIINEGELDADLKGILTISNLRNSLFGKYLESSKKRVFLKTISYLESTKFDEKKILELGIFRKLFSVLISEIENLSVKHFIQKDKNAAKSDLGILLNKIIFNNSSLEVYSHDEKLFTFFKSLSGETIECLLEKVSKNFDDKNKRITEITHSLERIMTLELELRRSNIKDSLFSINWLMDLNGLQLAQQEFNTTSRFSDIFNAFIREITALREMINKIRLNRINLSGFMRSSNSGQAQSFTQKLVQSLGLFLGNYRMNGHRSGSINRLCAFIKGDSSERNAIGDLLQEFIKESLENYEMVILEEEIVLLSWMVVWKIIHSGEGPEPASNSTSNELQNLNIYSQFVMSGLSLTVNTFNSGAIQEERPTINETLNSLIEKTGTHCIGLSLSLDTSENKRLSKTHTEEGKLKMLESKVEQLAVYEYKKKDRIRRQFRRDLNLSKTFKTYLKEFEHEQDGIEHNYIRRVAQVNQNEISEDLYSKEKGMRKVLSKLRESEFQENEEAEKSGRLLLKEFNTISSLFVRSIGLSILSHNAHNRGQLGVWEGQDTASVLGQTILQIYSERGQLQQFPLSNHEEDVVFKNYFRSKITNFDKNESEMKISSCLMNFCRNDKTLLRQLTDLQVLKVSSFEFFECDSLSFLLNFYSSTGKNSVVNAETLLSKPSILELDVMTRLSCFKLVQDQKAQKMFDFYNDQIDSKSMNEFVLLLDELMLWIEGVEKEVVEMAGMPVLVSIKNLVLKIAKFGSECPYR